MYSFDLLRFTKSKSLKRYDISQRILVHLGPYPELSHSAQADWRIVAIVIQENNNKKGTFPSTGFIWSISKGIALVKHCNQGALMSS